MVTAKNRHIQWIDAARGIGIVLVVIGHVERGLVAASVAQGPFWKWLDYSLYTFHMPLFFFLAGLNVPRALKKGKAAFLWGKAWTIAYPYFLWSVVQGGVLIALSSLTNGTAHVSDLLRIGWAPMSQFWFLYALMLCQVAAAIIGGRRGVLAIIAALSLLASYFLQWGILTQTMHNFPFFAAGILLAGRIKEWKNVAPCAALCFIVLALSVALSGLQDGMDFNSPWALPATISGIACVILAAQALGGNVLFIALGAASMTIYILHILAASGTRIIMKKAGFIDPSFYLAVCTLIGLIAPYIAHEILKRRRLLAPLGLAARERT